MTTNTPHLKDLDIPVIQNILDYILVDKLDPKDAFITIVTPSGPQRISFLLSQKSYCTQTFIDYLLTNKEYIEPWRTIYINTELSYDNYGCIRYQSPPDYSRIVNTKNQWIIAAHPNYFCPGCTGIVNTAVTALDCSLNVVDYLKTYLNDISMLKNQSNIRVTIDRILVSDQTDKEIAGWNNLQFEHICFAYGSKACPEIEKRARGIVIARDENWRNIARMQDNIKSMWIYRDCGDVIRKVMRLSGNKVHLKKLSKLYFWGCVPSKSFYDTLILLPQVHTVVLDHFTFVDTPIKPTANDTKLLHKRFRLVQGSLIDDTHFYGYSYYPYGASSCWSNNKEALDKMTAIMKPFTQGLNLSNAK